MVESDKQPVKQVYVNMTMLGCLSFLAFNLDTNSQEGPLQVRPDWEQICCL